MWPRFFSCLTQLAYIHNTRKKTHIFSRGCATNCTSSMVSADGTVISLSCCEGDACNTDQQGKLVHISYLRNIHTHDKLVHLPYHIALTFKIN